MSIAPLNELPSRPSPGAAGALLGGLYAEHSRLVYGICRMLLRDPNEAEDATQEVFLSAYRSLLTGTEVRDPAAWLGTIARNACRRRAVARMREPLAVPEPPASVSPGADEEATGRERAAALYAELATLPAKQREAVVLRDLYGLRYDEVAAALGTSRPAVEALLFRGRRRLQLRLRPGFAAGVLVVPLAVQESIAYAVPGFAVAAAPAAGVATAAGIPLLAKLAAAGAAVGIAGSAGFGAERDIRDSSSRPAVTPIEAVAPATAKVEPMLAAALLPKAPAGSPIAERQTEDSGDGERAGGDRDGTQGSQPEADDGDKDGGAVEAPSVGHQAESDDGDAVSVEADGGESGEAGSSEDEGDQADAEGGDGERAS